VVHDQVPDEKAHNYILVLVGGELGVYRVKLAGQTDTLTVLGNGKVWMDGRALKNQVESTSLALKPDPNGQNDGIQDSAAFCGAYIRFIGHLRQVYPSARIVLLTSPMGDVELTAVLKRYIDGVVRSFRFQAFDRICQCRPDCLGAHRDQCDQKSSRTCREEDPPTEAYAVYKVLQPFIHDPPREWGGDDEGDAHQFQKIRRKQAGDPLDACSQDLSDPDLLCSLFSDKGRQSKHPQTGDQDCQYREDDRNLSNLLFGPVHLVKGVIEESVAEWYTGSEGRPFGPDLADQRGDARGIHLKGGEVGASLEQEHEGADFVMQGLKIEILYETYDRVGEWLPRVVEDVYILSDRIGVSQDTGGCLVDDHRRRVRCESWREVATLQ
jgi:hypothetical protein